MKIINVNGRLVNDPTLRTVNVRNKDTAVATFSIANNDDCKNRNGKEDPAHVDYFDITVWGPRAESIAKYLKKGRAVLISGTPHVEHYTAKDGMNRRHFNIVAREVTFLDAAPKKETQIG